MKYTLTIRQHFQKLPEPHRTNCLNSMPVHHLGHSYAYDAHHAVCLIDTNNGFCPPQYYIDLAYALKTGKL